MRSPSNNRTARRFCLLAVGWLLASLAHVSAQVIPPFRSLATFPATPSGASYPGALIQGTDGKFYCMEKYGGLHGNGEIYSLIAGFPGVASLHSFTATDPDGNNTDGRFPEGGLVQASDGNFYGVTSSGGAHGGGTFFKMTPAGALTVLRHLGGTGGTGYPVGGLLLASDGNFYGNTASGGANGDGAVLKLTPAGVVTVVFNFNHAAGGPATPAAVLTQDPGGNFYGTTERGGAHDAGSVFQLTPTGTLTVLRSFNPLDGNGHNNGGTDPQSAVVRGRDGNFYGTTKYGGTLGGGVVYKVTPAGAFATLHNFDPSNGDGYKPFAALTPGRDGYYYGTTELGGANDTGTVFQIKGSGVETVLYSFSALVGEGTNTDGAYPLAALIQAKDNNFYGTTYEGGEYFGTIFSFDNGPAITSDLTVSATFGQPFSYQITATDSPTRYGAASLLPGLTVNTATGLISGTPMPVPGSRPPHGIATRVITLKATNSEGTGIARLTLTATLLRPVITSPTSASATVGQPFSYQITAANYPDHFLADYPLPSSLSLNYSTGLISGTPASAGTYKLNISALNTAGNGSATLTLTVAPQ